METPLLVSNPRFEAVPAGMTAAGSIGAVIEDCMQTGIHLMIRALLPVTSSPKVAIRCENLMRLTFRSWMILGNEAAGWCAC